jgi:hypothetical protein
MGAHIVFADIRRDTLNLDERALPALITGRTRPSCRCTMPAWDEMPTIRTRRGADRGMREDNAHGLFRRYCRKLGTRSLATLSFMRPRTSVAVKAAHC